MFEFLTVWIAALLAGLIDSIAGGGGLILVPTLFGVFTSAPPATLLGTNKGVAICGTAFAARRYAREVKLNWAALTPAIVAAMAGSALGAWTVTRVSTEGLRRALPVLLVAVFVYTLFSKSMGMKHDARFTGRAEVVATCLIGFFIGYYDGFFGPGTGSFFMFLFVRVMGFDFLHAAASTKMLNLATNLSAIAMFIIHDAIWFEYALALGVANVLGSVIGTRLAFRHGSGFIRVAFITVVGLLILKSGYDAARVSGLTV